MERNVDRVSVERKAATGVELNRPYIHVVKILVDFSALSNQREVAEWEVSRRRKESESLPLPKKYECNI